MKKSIKESHTLYAVKGYLPKRQESIQIGKLGHFAFEKGYYVYVGSAKRNIRSRVNRHIAVEKKAALAFGLSASFFKDRRSPNLFR